jgi:hypothetical protein
MVQLMMRAAMIQHAFPCDLHKKNVLCSYTFLATRPLIRLTILYPLLEDICISLYLRRNNSCNNKNDDSCDVIPGTQFC